MVYHDNFNPNRESQQEYFGVSQGPGESVVGKCSKCGGTVVKHTGPWMGIYPPKARCTKCGGVEDETANLPTIPIR